MSGLKVYSLCLLVLSVGLLTEAVTYTIVDSEDSPCRYTGYRDDCNQFAVSNGTAIVVRASREMNYKWCWVFCGRDDNDEYRAKVYGDYMSTARAQQLVLAVLQKPADGANPLAVDSWCEVSCSRWGLRTPGAVAVGLSASACNQFKANYQAACVQGQSESARTRMIWKIFGIVLGAIAVAILFTVLIVRMYSYYRHSRHV